MEGLLSTGPTPFLKIRIREDHVSFSLQQSFLTDGPLAATAAASPSVEDDPISYIYSIYIK